MTTLGFLPGHSGGRGCNFKKGMIIVSRLYPVITHNVILFIFFRITLKSKSYFETKRCPLIGRSKLEKCTYFFKSVNFNNRWQIYYKHVIYSALPCTSRRAVLILLVHLIKIMFFKCRKYLQMFHVLEQLIVRSQL